MATSKYNEIEIQTAENLLKRGFKWIARGIYGAIIAYKIKTDQEKYRYGKVICSDLVPIFESIRCGDDPVSLESVVHPQILDEAERKYLSAVIKPFRDEIHEIIKHNTANGKFQWICFTGENEYDGFYLPNFKAGTMYKGMEVGRKYTLEELGL